MMEKELRLAFRGLSDDSDSDGEVVELPDLDEEDDADGDGFGDDNTEGTSEFSEF